MAQLRDALTSELLGEGTPTEMVLLAEHLGRSDVLFDGVEGEHNPGTFDPDAVLQAHEENIAGLLTAAAEAKGDEKSALQRAAKAAAAVADDVAELAGDAQARMEAARERADL